MQRPSERCEFDYDPDADMYKPYCCSRRAWRGGRCVWHAPVKGKPGELLNESRVTGTAGFPPSTGDKWIGRHGERLDGAILRGADLSRVHLGDCSLFGADLATANLEGGNLSHSHLRKANLSGAKARRVLLSNANLRDATLSNADLRGADLSNADLSGADLSNADLRDADLSGTDLRKADLTEATLQGAQLQGSHLYQADLSGADLIRTELKGATLAKATLHESYLMRADLTETNLQEADLGGADVRRADLADAKLGGASFRGADLTKADLTEVEATGVDFTGALLERAALSRADLYDATFEGARFYGATFGGAGINEQTSFGDRVPYDPATAATDGGTADTTAGNDSVGSLTKAAGSYRLLEQLARENEFTDLRTQTYLRRKRVQRQSHRENGRYERWIRSAISNYVVGYGERPGRVVATGAVVVVLSALLYPLGLVETIGGETLTYSDGVATALVESLYVSVMTFTTGAPGYTPTGLGRFVAGAESVLGLLLFAVLLFAVVRRGTR